MGGAYGMGGMPGMGMGMGMGMPGQTMPLYGTYGAYGAPQGMVPQQQKTQYAMAGGYKAYGAAAGAGGAQGMNGMPQQQHAAFGQQQPGMGMPQQAAAKPVAASSWKEHKTDDSLITWLYPTTGVSQVRNPRKIVLLFMILYYSALLTSAPKRVAIWMKIRWRTHICSFQPSLPQK